MNFDWYKIHKDRPLRKEIEMIKPTVGRIVWFWSNETQDQPCAAIISRVNPDSINVGVFNAHGLQMRNFVTLYQGEGDKPSYPYAEWMPYQKGQAAKTEILEKSLNERK